MKNSCTCRSLQLACAQSLNFQQWHQGSVNWPSCSNCVLFSSLCYWNSQNWMICRKSICLKNRDQRGYLELKESMYKTRFKNASQQWGTAVVMIQTFSARWAVASLVRLSCREKNAKRTASWSSLSRVVLPIGVSDCAGGTTTGSFTTAKKSISVIMESSSEIWGSCSNLFCSQCSFRLHVASVCNWTTVIIIRIRVLGMEQARDALLRMCRCSIQPKGQSLQIQDYQEFLLSHPLSPCCMHHIRHQIWIWWVLWKCLMSSRRSTWFQCMSQLLGPKSNATQDWRPKAHSKLVSRGQ